MWFTLPTRKMRSSVPWRAISGDYDYSHDIDLDTPLFVWPNTNKTLTLRESTRGVQIFGATGSGKTSGSGAFIAQSLLSKGIGGIVHTCKKDDYALWKKFGEMTGRAESIVRIGWESTTCINIFEYMRQNTVDRDNVHVEIADLFRDIIFDRIGEESANFWTKARDLLVVNILKGIIDSGNNVTLHNFSRAISDLYLIKKSPEEAKFIKEMTKENSDLSDYFFKSLAALADETFSSTVFTLEVQLGRFKSSRSGKMFMGDTNIDPRIILDGAVLVIDTPLEKYGDEGLLVNLMWKAIIEKMILKYKTRKTPVTFKWEDEAHNLVSKRDSIFNSTSRDKNHINVYCTQGVNNYLVDSRGASEKAISALLLNIGTKIFHQTTEDKTYRLIQELAGEVEKEKKRTHKNSRNEESMSLEKVNETKIKRESLLGLKKGGASSKYMVEAYVSASGDESNVTPITFDQRWVPKISKAGRDFTVLI